MIIDETQNSVAQYQTMVDYNLVDYVPKFGQDSYFFKELYLNYISHFQPKPKIDKKEILK